MTTPLSPQDALVALMTLTSAADRNMTDAEMKSIDAMLTTVPAFEGYDRDRIGRVTASVVDVLQTDDGVETLLGMIKNALPDRLYETAYALACDVAAADGRVKIEEARFLELIRHELNLDRLISAGIERGARARHTRID